jgi:sugar transferase (PEP-CTERM system associated)
MLSTSWRSVVLIGGESGLLFIAVAIGSYFRIGDYTWILMSRPGGMLRVLLIVFVCQVCLHYADLYDLRSVAGPRDLLVRLFHALGAAALIMAVLYYWFPDWVIGRGVFLISAVTAIAFVVTWRLLFKWLSGRIGPRERLLLVGTNAAAVDLARELYERREELGVEIVGFVDPDATRVGAAIINPGVIGTVDDIPSLVTSYGVDRVVVSLREARGTLPMNRLLDIRLQNGVGFEHLASVYEEYTGKIAVEHLRPSWLIFSDGFRKTRALLAQKRVFDVVASMVGLVVTAPFMLAIAALVKLSSHGPVLYHQERVGLNGRVFTVHKFRTMREDAEAGTGPVWSGPNDDRITATGRFLRRARLDELPQLWNVLRGEMSLVGPRPERPEFVQELTAGIPFYGQRHVVKPGVTGWAQIRYTYGASVEDALEKLQYDLYYIKNLSIALDLVIALETIKTVVLRRGAR